MALQPTEADGSQRAPQPGGQFFAVVEHLVAWMTANRVKILRYAWILQLFGGLLFLGLSHLMGHEHLHLIRQGVRAPGTVVGYKEQSFRHSSGFFSTGYMPVVEFHANDRLIHFQDWMGSNSAGARNVPVIVLYDPANPSVAMIDRPVWNWLPWAPIFALGLFLVLVAINGFLRSQRSAEA